MKWTEEVVSMATRGYLFLMRRSDAGGDGLFWSIVESARVRRPMGTQR